jgi:hypothetical protein
MPGSTANTLNSVTIKSGTTNMNSNYIITTANGTFHMKLTKLFYHEN